jgi:hypothetical protein
MQNEMHSQNIESVEASIALRELTTSSELAEDCGPNRKLRLRVRLPSRASCLTRRAMVAALREAELERWEANGGDYLRSAQRLA